MDTNQQPPLSSAQQYDRSQPAQLYSDNLRPEVFSREAGKEDLIIEGDMYKLLYDFCDVQGATPFTVLLSVFRATHFCFTGAEDATIGSLVINQSQEALSPPGFFSILQCIRTTVQDDTLESHPAGKIRGNNYV